LIVICKNVKNLNIIIFKTILAVKSEPNISINSFACLFSTTEEIQKLVNQQTILTQQ